MGKNPEDAGKTLTLEQMIAIGKSPDRLGAKTVSITAKAAQINRAREFGWSWARIQASLAAEGVEASIPTIRQVAKKAEDASKRKGRAKKANAPMMPESKRRLSPAGSAAADAAFGPVKVTPTAAATAPTEPPAPTPGKAPENDLEQHAAFRRRDRKP